MIKQILVIDGYSVRMAHNGEDGLRQLREHKPDLVVTDTEMPILDGPGMAYRRFLEDAGLERVPIVIISGFPEPKTLAECVGTPYFISKPIEINAALALIKKSEKGRFYKLARHRCAQRQYLKL